MKRKIPALLLALLLVFSAALPASAAGRACLRSSPASACTRLRRGGVRLHRTAARKPAQDHAFSVLLCRILSENTGT